MSLPVSSAFEFRTDAMRLIAYVVAHEQGPQKWNLSVSGLHRAWGPTVFSGSLSQSWFTDHGAAIGTVE